MQPSFNSPENVKRFTKYEFLSNMQDTHPNIYLRDSDITILPSTTLGEINVEINYKQDEKKTILRYTLLEKKDRLKVKSTNFVLQPIIK